MTASHPNRTKLEILKDFSRKFLTFHPSQQHSLTPQQPSAATRSANLDRDRPRSASSFTDGRRSRNRPAVSKIFRQVDPWPGVNIVDL